MIRSLFRVGALNNHKSTSTHVLRNKFFNYSTNNPNQGNGEHRNTHNHHQNSSRVQFFKRGAFIVCTGVIGCFLGYVVFGQEESKEQMGKNQKVGGTNIGGQWKLIDSSQKVYSSEDLAGSYYLIYFGYALCPDICPTTLHYLSKVHRHLNNTEQGKSINLKTVFVSVDPKRDTPQKIAQYVKMFDGSIIGLTGRAEDDQDFRRTLQSFKVYANKIKNEQGSSYNIDHTSIVYLMGPQSQFVGSVNPSKTQRQTAQQLIQKIASHHAVKKFNSGAL